MNCKIGLHYVCLHSQYNLADWTSSCTGTIVSDSDYGSFLIYTFSTDTGTSGTMTVTDSWVKELTFNTGPSLLSSGGGQPSGASCDTTKSVFIMAVAANLPSGSNWNYNPSSGTFTINVGGMSSSTFYYLGLYYFPRTTNSNANFFASKPSLLFSPTTMTAGTQYIVSSSLSPFSVRPPGASWPDWVRVFTSIPYWVPQTGTGTWFVGADPYYWDGGYVCGFPPNGCTNTGDDTGYVQWWYGPPWQDVYGFTSANPIQFSWNYVYYGQLAYSGTPLTGCYYKNKGEVGVDFLSIGTDLLATLSPYPNNLPTVKPGTYPTSLRISMDSTINMGTVTDSFGNTFNVWNGIESWVDWHARNPARTTVTDPSC